MLRLAGTGGARYAQLVSEFPSLAHTAFPRFEELGLESNDISTRELRIRIYPKPSTFLNVPTQCFPHGIYIFFRHCLTWNHYEYTERCIAFDNSEHIYLTLRWFDDMSSSHIAAARVVYNTNSAKEYYVTLLLVNQMIYKNTRNRLRKREEINIGCLRKL